MKQPLSIPIAGCMRWGKWGANFSKHQYESLIRECLANNITSFDHADIYGEYTTEEEFGTVLKTQSSLRQEIQLITKCGIQIQSNNRLHHTIKSYNTSKEHIVQSVENSLRHFNTDYIDILLIHRPDPLLNPIEVAEAITALKKTGKIIQFGVSNFLPHQIEVLRKHILIEYNQIEISILNTTAFANGTLDYCLQQEIIPMAWAPLGGGIMTNDSHPRYQLIAARATALAKKYNTSVNQILIVWLVQHPAKIIPVLGTTKLERLLQAQYIKDFKLTREDWFLLYSSSLGAEIP